MGRISHSFARTASALALGIGLAVGQASIASAQDGATSPSATVSSPTGIPAWGITSADIAPDPDIVFGRLDNGMRYALQRNTNPVGEAAIRFTVEVGSREETDAENGAAHFVEHMAFNGSTNIPEGDLLPMLERLGLAFGADTNAETSLDYTTYKLALPNTQDETVERALNVIREMAGELTFTPEAVERERGVLLSEAQLRNDPNRRRITDYLQTALPNSRLGERVRADVERIRRISAADLRAFYDAYYRPERATLAIVGDFDIAEMERRIKAEFGDWQGEGAPRDIYRIAVPQNETLAIANFVDPAIPEIIELQRITAWEPAENTVADTRAQFLRAIAGIALSNRIAALSRAADSPTLGAQALEQPLFRSVETYGLLIVSKDGQWRDTLALAERELRRANQYGFTAAEIAEAKANIETALANAVSQAAGRPSAGLAEALVAASLADSVPTAPAADLALYRAIEMTVTAETVSDAFRAAWQGGPSLVHVSTKQPIEGGAQAIAAALSESAEIAVTALEEAAAVDFAYSDWGEPGTVVSDETIEDFGIRTVRFANGLQLNLKTTDFEPGKIAFSLRTGSGVSAFPSDRAGLKDLLPIAISVDGLEAHGPDELRRVVAGRSVTDSLAAANGALVASGSTVQDDLQFQLDLLAARLTATAWRPETQAQLAGVAPILVKNIRSAPTAVFGSALNAVLSGGDARLGVADPNSLAEVTLDDLQAVVAPQLADGPLALGLVGDIDQDAAIAAVAATLGALPERALRDEDGAAPAPVSFVADKATKVLTHTGQPDQGVLSLSWQTDDSEDLRDDIARDLLAATMGLRLTETLREDLGATYSPQAISFSQQTFDGFGHITAFATVPPEAMDETAGVLREIAGEMAAQEVSADLLERARNPIRAGYERAESQNSAWLDVVAMAQSDPVALDRRRQRLDILNAITPADIRQAARTYLADDRAVEIRVVPESGG